MPSSRRTPSTTAPGADTELSEAVGRVVRGWMRNMKAQGRAFGLSLPQLMLIRSLCESGEVPVSQWAQLIGASPSATTGLLDGLEKDGLVRRTHARDDRRQVLISLLPRGRRLADRMVATQLRSWRAYCRGIPPRRLRLAAGTLALIADQMSALGPRPPKVAPARPARRSSP